MRLYPQVGTLAYPDGRRAVLAPPFDLWAADVGLTGAPYLDPDGLTSNTGFAVTGAASADAAIADYVRSATTPSRAERLSVTPGPTTGGTAEFTLTSFNVT